MTMIIELLLTYFEIIIFFSIICIVMGIILLFFLQKKDLSDNKSIILNYINILNSSNKETKDYLMRLNAKNIYFNGNIKLVSHVDRHEIKNLNGPVWLTFDIDGLDGLLVPATGTPVPGGLSYWGAIEIIEALRIIVKPYIQNHEAFDNLKGETDFISDLKINSANLVDIILDIEERFDIEIDNESMDKMLNVKATIEVINTKISEK